MSHHPERTARNVRPVNQPPSKSFVGVFAPRVENNESRLNSAREQNASAVFGHLVNDFDRLVGGRRARALRTRASDVQRIAVSRPRTLVGQRHVEAALQVLPRRRGRVMRSRALVVDAVPLRDQPVLHVACAGVCGI